MENLNIASHASNKISQLMENITATCGALLSALEVNAQSVGSYGGGILQQFDSEFVDRVVKNLLKIKLHITKISKELKNGLISSSEELTYVFGGLQGLIDELDTIMLEDGFMKNNFSFLIEEMKADINQILEEIDIAVVV
ncbi:MAG: hypothetical protein LBH96_02010 [Candidatus Peribacteria bacterium]|jgi:hypothetical protein|nr:hypothetical protein [Candidatus Peribacteria bacterium]